MSGRRSGGADASSQHPVLSSAHASMFQTHGLDMNKVMEWVKFFGTAIGPFIAELISLLKSTSGPADDPTPGQVGVLAKHGMSAEQASVCSAAGIDTSKLIQWLSDFASSGKLPQLIQVIMTLVHIFKPAAVMQAKAQPSESAPVKEPSSSEEE